MNAVWGLAVALGLWFWGAVPAFSADGVGFRSLTVPAPARGMPIAVDLWYPAGPGGTPERHGASPLFEGVSVRRDAAVADGAFPLVLLAHGGLRSNPLLAGWIAAHLAARGALVVLPHAPMPRASSPETARAAPGEVSLRPEDLRAALDAVQGDPALAAHLAAGEVSAVGFFLGGTSVLALAGARLDPAAYRASCDPPVRGPDCRWFAANGVDLHTSIPDAVGASHRDPRVRAVVAINPELVGSFTPDSLGGIDIPVTVIRLGAGEDAATQRRLPAARYLDIAGANSFDAFSRCTPRALALLAEEGENDAICREDGPRSRADFQAEMARMIDDALAGRDAAP
ncbi:hypothetical protein MKI84_17635 [Ancylobacter sp. A5.8]|uniref:alpha/beta hydrolase family protein n=1 Tax=Ancylobacter gelatini TaxID=2919920 RepID=UPI001F4E9106|nr:hypothetical protein [Ancylobacter gelatini]MCJ8144746.1 hypothetical protein [Ancylobacter gelatini]